MGSPFTVDPADVPDEAVRVIRRTLLRHAPVDPMDDELARLIFAVVITFAAGRGDLDAVASIAAEYTLATGDEVVITAATGGMMTERGELALPELILRPRPRRLPLPDIAALPPHVRDLLAAVGYWACSREVRDRLDHWDELDEQDKAAAVNDLELMGSVLARLPLRRRRGWRPCSARLTVQSCKLYDMAVPLTINVPDDLMQQFQELAERQFRTPEQQALWLIKLAIDSSKGNPQMAPGKREQGVAAMLAELRSLWLLAGGPSSRVVSKMIYEQTATRISHTTVNGMMSGTASPTWPTLERVVKVLGGDVEHYRQLWGAANPARSTEDLR